MHDHTKQQLEETIKRILKPFIYHKYGKTYIGHAETEGALRVEGMVLQLGKEIQQALKSQAEMIRAEMDSTIGSLNGLGGCECCISKVNKQKAKLDELINSFE